jgi:hypothetical protein
MASGSWERDDNRFLSGLNSSHHRHVLIGDYDHERKLFALMSILAGIFLLIDIGQSTVLTGHPTRNLATGEGLVLLFLLNLILSYRADSSVKFLKALDLLVQDNTSDVQLSEESELDA